MKKFLVIAGMLAILPLMNGCLEDGMSDPLDECDAGASECVGKNYKRVCQSTFREGAKWSANIACNECKLEKNVAVCK